MALAGLSAASASAQEWNEIPTDKYSVATNRFGGNWFITVGGDYTAFYSDEEQGLGLSTNPFKSFRRSWGADVAFGKWFTPGLGVRIKGQGLWGKAVIGNPSQSTDQFNVTAQAMFNLHNLFGGYKPNRIWNISLYGGAGVARVWSARTSSSLMATVGLYNTFRLSDRMFIQLDLYANLLEDKGDGIVGNHSSRNFRNRDRNAGVSLGLGVNLGKTGWSKTPDVDAIMALNKSQMDALNASLADQQAENARLKALLAKQPKESKPVVEKVKEYVGTSASVFFNINSSRIASKKDLVNVKEMAEFAKANNLKIVVKGYADSNTGSAEYNKRLSERRAETVANQLVEMGLSRDQIVVEAMGGVKDLTPISYNRRATVQVK